MKMNRLLYILLLFFMLINCSSEREKHKKVLVLGIDGMDPKVLSELMAAGKMPTFKKFAKEGSFKNLYSSIPPQSPVAWSNMITGDTPSGHSIFDFIHREPETLTPYLSTSRIEEPTSFVSIGKWRLPLKSGGVKLLRKGIAFWQILEKQGIPATVIKMPSNFPPAKSENKTLSGMGTPDIHGTYGEFSFYTNDPEFVNKKDEISGGKIIPIKIKNGAISTELIGPVNIFKKNQPNSKIPFNVYIDNNTKTVRIDIQDAQFILEENELSEWITVEFGMIPYLSKVKGICKFMVTGVNPYFKLYVSPINIDPRDPAMPISTPDDFAGKLAEKVGLYYTQGMAEDTKAFEFDIFNIDQYLTQVKYIFEKRKKMFRHFLNTWDSGVLFFYFSTLDQNSHMLWWQRDSESPIFSKEIYDKYGDLVAYLYMEMDDVLKETLQKIEDDVTILIISDHGFAPYYKKFNLNTWLYKEGYIKMNREWNQEKHKFFETLNWSETKAYGLGINSLYINLRGREITGIVDGFEKLELLKEIKEKLLMIKDPETGKNVIKNVYIVNELYPNSDLENMPDMIIGYASGYRCSDESALGEFPKGILKVNTDKWSGDHCMDYTEVPGILISNKKITKDKCYLYDVTPTILKEYNINTPEHMKGSPFF